MYTLEKVGFAFTLTIVFFALKFIFEYLYTYVVGPVVNKVHYTSKGKWARKYLHNLLFFASLFL